MIRGCSARGQEGWTMIDFPDELLRRNRVWAESVREDDPTFFDRLSAQQAPEILWIGCSDSRVPANQITGLMPGEVFVHRNIANLVIHTDINCQAVIQFAVEALKVRHIIVCGHYGCGGVRAAMESNDYGLLHNWLRNIKDVYLQHDGELSAISDEQQRFDRMCEINVRAQVHNLARSSTVQNAWEQGQSLALHGWIYSIRDGLLQDLEVDLSGIDHVPPIYHTRSHGR
jgi:carbonic anhydrase